jgi:hypothetical protein
MRMTKEKEGFKRGKQYARRLRPVFRDWCKTRMNIILIQDMIAAAFSNGFDAGGEYVADETKAALAFLKEKSRGKRDRRKRRKANIPAWLVASVVSSERRHGTGRRSK